MDRLPLTSDQQQARGGEPCRMQDLGVLSAAEIASRDMAFLDAHAAGLIGDQLYFHRSAPAVAIGCHQVAEREARQPYCSEAGVAVVRRVTAGGAIYLDGGQQCFSLIVPAAKLGSTMAERLERGAALVAAGLRRLGIDTGFKPPNDLQVASRQKIASVFAAERGGSLLLSGSVIAELDLKRAMQALLVPTEKLTVTGLEHAKERMTSLAEGLGHTPSGDAVRTALAGGIEEGLILSFHEEAGLEDDLDIEAVAMPEPAPWQVTGAGFETKDKVAGATLRLLLDLADDGSLRLARFATDGHFAPEAALTELGRVLAGARPDDAVVQTKAWFASHRFDPAGFTSGDVVKLVERAVSKLSLQNQLGLTPEQASGLMLAGAGSDPSSALAKANVMLVPYCAKPNWCKWRHTIDCVECGECEVGDAYAMARERNMEVITITNFEHLAETLGKMKAEGVESYVGMCCGEFFLKRHHAFRDSGMDAVLLDIEGATCYELKEEHLAYAGAFKAEARLDLDAVKKVMEQVPVKPASERPCITGLLKRPAEKHKARKALAGCGNCSCGKAVAAE